MYAVQSETLPQPNMLRADMSVTKQQDVFVCVCVCVCVWSHACLCVLLAPEGAFINNQYKAIFTQPVKQPSRVTRELPLSRQLYLAFSKALD